MTGRKWTRLVYVVVALTLVTGGITMVALLFTGGATVDAGKEQIWTCSMHPHIRLPHPGKCPICGMTLIPLGADDTGPRQYAMMPEAVRLAEIVTEKAKRQPVKVKTRLVGNITYDEGRVRKIAAWIPGRIDRVFVDSTGISVAPGEHLVKLYSPELYAAQEELLQAITTSKDMQESRSSLMRDSAKAQVEAAKERLRLWGMEEDQIAAVLSSGKPATHVEIRAPIGGVIVHKNALEGVYVKTGTPLYTIADLSVVWLEIEAYETDLVWVRAYQSVRFTVQAFPGETFTGRVAFVEPTLNERTRTVNVRVFVDNPGGRLKPGMFAHAIIESQASMDGPVIDKAITGMWVSPMHPQIIRNRPGKCPICGMPLVRAEEFLRDTHGLEDDGNPLVIPVTAPLITGKRAVAYVRVPGKQQPTFEGREIVLGPRAGKFYLVKSGLEEGEDVVTQGAFKIDSALQISAKPSMMNPTGGGGPVGGHAGMKMDMSAKTVSAAGKKKDSAAGMSKAGAPKAKSATPPALLTALGKVFDEYIAMQERLAVDDVAGARSAVRRLKKRVAELDSSPLGEDSRMGFDSARKEVASAVESVKDQGSLKGLRKLFDRASRAVTPLIDRFGRPGDKPAVVAYCPMEKKSWLQFGRKIKNPFLGKKMPTCGEVKRAIQPVAPHVETPEEQQDAFMGRLARLMPAANRLARALREGGDEDTVLPRAKAVDRVLLLLGEKTTPPAWRPWWLKRRAAMLNLSEEIQKEGVSTDERLSRTLKIAAMAVNAQTDAVLGAKAWTCSMHPQIRMSEPGKCPICAMDLVPFRATPAPLPKSTEGSAPKDTPATTAYVSAPREFQRSAGRVLDAALAMQRALAADDASGALTAGKTLRERLGDLKPKALDENQRARVVSGRDRARKALSGLKDGATLEELRTAFGSASPALIELARTFGHESKASLSVMRCPMVNRSWLQAGAEISNPYYGRKMSDCGVVTATLPPRPPAPAGAEAAPADDGNANDGRRDDPDGKTDSGGHESAANAGYHENSEDNNATGGDAGKEGSE